MPTDPREDIVNMILEPTDNKVTTHGFLMGVELEPNTDMNKIVFDIMAICAKNRMIRDMDIEHLGEIETYGEAEGNGEGGEQLDLPFDTGNKEPKGN